MITDLPPIITHQVGPSIQQCQSGLAGLHLAVSPGTTHYYWVTLGVVWGNNITRLTTHQTPPGFIDFQMTKHHILGHSTGLSGS